MLGLLHNNCGIRGCFEMRQGGVSGSLRMGTPACVSWMWTAQEGLAGLAGSRGRAELCLPLCSVALSICVALVNLVACIVYRWVLELGCPEGRSPLQPGWKPAGPAHVDTASLRAGSSWDPELAGARVSQGCCGATFLRAREQSAPHKTPSKRDCYDGEKCLLRHFPAVVPETVVLPCLLAPCVQHKAVTGWHPTHSGAGQARTPWVKDVNIWKKVDPLSSGHHCQVIILHLPVSMATCWLAACQ